MTVFYYFLLFVLFPALIYAQGLDEHLRYISEKFANKLKKGDERSREFVRKFEAGLPPAVCSPDDRFNDCTNLECFCRGYLEYHDTGPIYNGNCPLPDYQWMQKAVRKEYRVLSDYERQMFHEAMWRIKQNGRFDALAQTHRTYSRDSQAHFGPGFLPWHREFLKQAEFELRRVDPDVGIPYWDSTLDSILPDPRASIIWSPEFMGNGDGQVVEGTFAGWQTIENKTLERAIGVDPYSSTFHNTQIESYLKITNIDNALGMTKSENCPRYKPTGMEIETTHGLVHLWVGGDMHETERSANDPIFYLLHSFVDGVWEHWRNKHQSTQQKESEYPRDDVRCFNRFHLSESFISPNFGCSRIGSTNKVGLSNDYLDNLYEYEQRPTCDNNCGNSPYLFCIQSQDKCASKIKLGGYCWGLVNEDACYNGVCRRGVCIDPEAPDREIVIPTLEMIEYEIQLIFKSTSCELLDSRVNAYLLSEGYELFWRHHLEDAKKMIKKYAVLLGASHCKGTPISSERVENLIPKFLES